MSSYATKLEKVLHERNISQSALARRIGVDKSLINKWVKGRHTPSAPFMTKIARELNMTEQELFFDTDFTGLNKD
ncbi:MAG TPA: helix-turn-helix transcriptional regulator [Anaerolineae bacterium]|jgi:transcriptional regulator with XRE-family HTH domain|nr:helix-turn-helix transcriptional regulator [Anaerolineae bacterium]